MIEGHNYCVGVVEKIVIAEMCQYLVRKYKHTKQTIEKRGKRV